MMHAVMNDISFRYSFKSRQQAIQSVREWLEICRELKSVKTTGITRLVVGNIDREFEIAPDYKWIQLIQEFTDIEDRRQLLTILQNSDTIFENSPLVYILQQESMLCTYAYVYHHICVSIASREEFCDSRLEGEVDGDKIEIPNLACKQHIDEYDEILGIRVYEANPKHGRVSYIRKGMTVSIMDLTDDVAQHVLNIAVEIEGCLYAKYKGAYYQFPNTRSNIYHGFRNDELPFEIKNKLKK